MIVTVAQEVPEGVRRHTVVGHEKGLGIKCLGELPEFGQVAPPNKRLPAHKHPDDRYGMVISGVHYVSEGEEFDEKLRPHVAGTFCSEPASTPHFGMTNGNGAILYF
jgi:hypothetical protein